MTLQVTGLSNLIIIEYIILHVLKLVRQGIKLMNKNCVFLYSLF